MKRFTLAMLMIAGSGLAQADYKVVNADGSELSQICVAATASKAALLETAASAGLSAVELDTVRCNGLSLARFAAKYSKPTATLAALPAGYLLKASDTSEATALCIAATKSEQEFMAVKSMYFGAEPKVETEVLCNGLPLKTFARKYGSTAMTISQR